MWSEKFPSIFFSCSSLFLLFGIQSWLFECICIELLRYFMYIQRNMYMQYFIPSFFYTNDSILFPCPFFFFPISLVVWFREFSILVHKHFLILLHGHKVLVLWTQHNLRLLLMEFLLFPILYKRPTLLCPQ